jgi:hypothetical protein
MPQRRDAYDYEELRRSRFDSTAGTDMKVAFVPVGHSGGKENEKKVEAEASTVKNCKLRLF